MRTNLSYVTIFLFINIFFLSVNAQELSTEDVKELRNEWVEIQKSSEHQNLEKLSKIFALNLNGLLLQGKTREETTIFLRENISKTKFATLKQAMEDYDKMTKASLALTTKYMKFYTTVGKARPDQLKVVFFK